MARFNLNSFLNNDRFEDFFAQFTGGTAGHDHLNGTASGNALFGDRGDDALSVMTGNDTLNGGTGDDLLVGGFGADVMNGAPATLRMVAKDHVSSE